jgi:hypothetical protein
MKISALVTLVLPLALCEPSYTFGICYCASKSRVGYVRSHTLNDDRGEHTFYVTGSVPRLGQKKHIIGKRCDNGTTTENCINIPKISSYPDMCDAAYEFVGRVNRNCYTFEDDVELCANSQYMRVDRGNLQEFMTKKAPRTDGPDCARLCKTQWDGRDDSALDISTYTLREGPMQGQLVQQNVKTMVNGKSVGGLYGCYGRTETRFKDMRY